MDGVIIFFQMRTQSLNLFPPGMKQPKLSQTRRTLRTTLIKEIKRVAGDPPKAPVTDETCRWMYVYSDGRGDLDTVGSIYLMVCCRLIETPPFVDLEKPLSAPTEIITVEAV